MIYASATALASSLTPSEISDENLYPAIERIREVSVKVAVGVIRAAQEAGVDREVRIRGMKSDTELEAWVRERMYDPHGEMGGMEKEVKVMIGDVGAGTASGGAGEVNGKVGEPEAESGGKSHL